MNDLVSVVIPVYNVEKYLQRCVDSVLQQTYRNLEVNLVDDGSTDLSSSLCDNLAINDRRITVVHKPNRGVSDSRNVGVSISTGSYITFCDSDDWIEPQTIETAYKAASLSDADVTIWSYYSNFVDANNNVVSRKEYTIDDGVINKGETSDYFLKDHVSGHLGYVWNKLYKRSIIEKIRFDTNLSLYEDIVYNSAVLIKANRVRFLEFAGSHYIQYEGESLGKKKHDNYIDLKLAAINARKRVFKAYGLSSVQIFKVLWPDYRALVMSRLRRIR